MNLLKVTLPKAAHVLLLEDSDMRIEWFKKRIPKLDVCKSVQEFKTFFENKQHTDFIFYDYDLGSPETGVDAAKYMAEHFSNANCWGLVHSWNRPGADAIRTYLPRLQHIPFGDFEVEVEQ